VHAAVHFDVDRCVTCGNLPVVNTAADVRNSGLCLDCVTLWMSELRCFQMQDLNRDDRVEKDTYHRGRYGIFTIYLNNL
jgi:hypothetical protein